MGEQSPGCVGEVLIAPERTPATAGFILLLRAAPIPGGANCPQRRATRCIGLAAALFFLCARMLRVSVRMEFEGAPSPDGRSHRCRPLGHAWLRQGVRRGPCLVRTGSALPW
jgi:hypothetical protein